MILDGIHRQLPVLLVQLDQPLREPHRILEEHVRVHHAVADEQRALEAVREIDR